MSTILYWFLSFIRFTTTDSQFFAFLTIFFRLECFSFSALNVTMDLGSEISDECESAWFFSASQLARFSLLFTLQQTRSSILGVFMLFVDVRNFLWPDRQSLTMNSCSSGQNTREYIGQISRTAYFYGIILDLGIIENQFV